MKAQNIVGKEFYRKDGASSIMPKVATILDVITDENGDQFYDVQFNHSTSRNDHVYPKDIYDNYIARTPSHVISYHSVQSEYNGIKFKNNIIVANRIRKVEKTTPIVILNTFEFLRKYKEVLNTSRSLSGTDVMSACTVKCMWDKFDQDSIPYFGNGVKLEKLSYAYKHKPLGIPQFSLPYDIANPEEALTIYYEMLGLTKEDIIKLYENSSYKVPVITHFDQIIYNNLLEMIDVDAIPEYCTICNKLFTRSDIDQMSSKELFTKFIAAYKDGNDDFKKQFNSWWNKFLYIALNIEVSNKGYLYDGSKRVNLDTFEVVTDLTTEEEMDKYIALNKDHHYAKVYFYQDDDLALVQYDDYEQFEAPAISMDELEKFFKLKI